MLKYSNIKTIDLQDWDNLVQETYNKPYSFQQQDGCQSRGVVYLTIPDKNYEDEDEMNDSIPEIINGDEMGVKFQVWLDRDLDEPLNPSKNELKGCGYYWGMTDEESKEWKKDKSNINMFWERNFYPNLQTLANDLYDKGLIEAGDYGIKIDW
jgi:hypothetical protein